MRWWRLWERRVDWIFILFYFILFGGWGWGRGEEKNGRSQLRKEVFLVLQRTELSIVIMVTSTETVGLLGTGSQDGHLDFHTAPELCIVIIIVDRFYTALFSALGQTSRGFKLNPC